MMAFEWRGRSRFPNCIDEISSGMLDATVERFYGFDRPDKSTEFIAQVRFLGSIVFARPFSAADKAREKALMELHRIVQSLHATLGYNETRAAIDRALSPGAVVRFGRRRNGAYYVEPEGYYSHPEHHDDLDCEDPIVALHLWANIPGGEGTEP